MKKNEICIKLALLVNQELYDDGKVSYELYSKTLNKLIGRLKNYGSI